MLGRVLGVAHGVACRLAFLAAFPSAIGCVGNRWVPRVIASPATAPLRPSLLLPFWATPDMSLAHLTFAVATTACVPVAIRFEARDLAAAHPDHLAYPRRVPKLLPWPSG